jgi:hypothetical protein
MLKHLYWIFLALLAALVGAGLYSLVLTQL